MTLPKAKNIKFVVEWECPYCSASNSNDVCFVNDDKKKPPVKSIVIKFSKCGRCNSRVKTCELFNFKN